MWSAYFLLTCNKLPPEWETVGFRKSKSSKFMVLHITDFMDECVFTPAKFRRENVMISVRLSSTLWYYYINPFPKTVSDLGKKKRLLRWLPHIYIWAAYMAKWRTFYMNLVNIKSRLSPSVNSTIIDHELELGSTKGSTIILIKTNNLDCIYHYNKWHEAWILENWEQQMFCVCQWHLNIVTTNTRIVNDIASIRLLDGYGHIRQSIYCLIEYQNIF